MALSKRRNRAATKIQMIWRGIWGRSRARGKGALDKAARNIRKNVDPRNLFVSDVKELRMRIYFALEKNQPHALPPDEVLYLLRMVTAIIQESTKTTNLGDLTYVNSRTYNNLDGYELTWEDGERLLSRYEKFLRLIRTMAYAPSSVPPCLINVPTRAKLLFTAQSYNRRWCLETFETMGHGAKLCCQLFKWLLSLIEISSLQQEFVSFYSTSYPDWLPRLSQLQRACREVEFKYVLSQKCNAILKDIREQIIDDQIYRSLLGREVARIRREIAQYEEQLDKQGRAIQHAKDAQTQREMEGLATLEGRLKKLEDELVELNKTYHKCAQQAAEGNKAVSYNIPKLREQMNLKQLAIDEMRSQLHMMTIQASQNQLRRQDKGVLPLEIRVKAVTAGESKALVIDAETKSRVLLTSEDVEFAEDLPLPKQRIYKTIKEQESTCLNIYQKLFMIADTHLQEFETTIVESIASVRNIEKQSIILPSEAELEEEKAVDEHEAMLARFKKKMFIPEAAIRAPIERARPVLVCLSRDLPAHAKEKIHREMTVSMPGLFISLDLETNMGLDVIAMQSVLDCKRCIIASVDHGLTKTSRARFLTALERTANSLIPSPFVVVAMADDFNKRMGTLDAHYGASKRDLQLMRDGDIKICLEGMAETLYEWGQSSINDCLPEIVENVFPPSPEFLVVAEALYVLQAETEDKFINPTDQTLKPLSWVAMRNFLIQPRTLLSTLQGIRRGRSSTTRLSVVSAYLSHPLWPPVGSSARIDDPILNLMAQYVEHWVKCEGFTKERGGTPLSPLTKGSLRGIQTVVVVSDVALGDPDDYTNMGESTLGWRTASLRLLRTALQDLRVLKVSKRVDGTLYNVSVYREDCMVYFDAYDPQTSQLYILNIRESQLPSLLLPSTHPNAQTVDSEPPYTPADMYTRLAALMHIKKVGNGRFARKVLYLHQDLLFLRNYTVRLNGHMVHVKCFEAALGEIVLKAYIPEFSASVEVSVDEETRLKLARNFDGDLERDLESSLDGRLLLPFMLDRLRASPSRPISQAWGGTATGSTFRKANPATLRKGQGLMLKVATAGGAGKTIFKRITHFSGIPHLFTVKSSSSSKLLRVIAYEPKTQSKMELRISPFLRRVVIGTDSDQANHWYKHLLDRLKVLWRGEHQLLLNTTIYKSVHKICKRRLIVSMDAMDEEHLKVSLVEATVGIPAFAILTKSDILALFSFEYVPKLSPHKALKKPAGVLTSVSNIFTGLFGSKDKEYQQDEPSVAASASPASSTTGSPRGKVPTPAVGVLSSSLEDSNAFSLSQMPPNTNSNAYTGSRLDASTSNEGFSISGMIRNTLSNTLFNVSAAGNTQTDPSMSTLPQFPGQFQAQSAGNMLVVGDDVSLRSLTSSQHGGMNNAALSESELLALADVDSLLPVLKNKGYLRKLAKCLESTVEFSPTSKQFSISSPVQVFFQPDNEFVKTRNVPMTASLRHHEEKHAMTALGMEPNPSDESRDVIIGSGGRPVDASLIAGGVAALVAGSVWGVLRARKQRIWFPMDSELDKLAAQRAQDVKEKKKSLYARYEPGKERSEADDTMSVLTDDGDMSAAIRARARSTAGLVKGTDDLTIWSHDGRTQVRIPRASLALDTLNRALKGEIVVFEEGCKISFRDGRALWSGHVSVKILETVCYYPPGHALEGQLGRRFRLVVFEPSTSIYYEGVIRSDKHLTEACGKKGTELGLMEPGRTTELLRYIARQRLYLSTIPFDEMDEVVAALPPDAPVPTYRVEFEIDRSFTVDKVTPITMSTEQDSKFNRNKLLDSGMLTVAFMIALSDLRNFVIFLLLQKLIVARRFFV
jgi:hypothetical protein